MKLSQLRDYHHLQTVIINPLWNFERKDLVYFGVLLLIGRFKMRI